MFSSYIKGFQESLTHKKMVTIVYLTTFFAGLILVFPFFGVLKSNLSYSILAHQLMDSFNFTTYSDITHNLSKAFAPVKAIFRLLGFGYFFFSIFLSGGIITVLLSKEKFNIKLFLSGCGSNFWRFFRITLYAVVCQIIVFVIILLLASMILSLMSASVQSEATLVYASTPFLVSFLASFILFNITADYAKIKTVREENKNVFRSYFSSLVFVFKNFSSYSLYIVNLIVPIALIGLYLFFENIVGMTTGFTIFVMIIIQQLFIWSRVFCKVWLISSEVDFAVKLIIIPELKIELDQENHEGEEEKIKAESELIETE